MSSSIRELLVTYEICVLLLNPYDYYAMLAVVVVHKHQRQVGVLVASQFGCLHAIFMAFRLDATQILQVLCPKLMRSSVTRT